jgi:lambda repressor-like predicted transcriptional regulator
MVADDATVGDFIAADWAEDLHDNTQGQLEAAVEALGMKLATQFELRFGDDAVVSLAETLRQTAEKMEKRLGEFIQKDRETAKIWTERYGENG